MLHELKTLPFFFAAVVDRKKTFEIRKNDRHFQPNDDLLLKEWDGEGYTGRTARVKVTYLTDYQQKRGYVVLGIRVDDVSF